MTQFFTPLRYENLDGSEIRLIEDFEFHVAEDHTICVPAGFTCDGQSIPRLLWILDTPQGRGARAGMVHDYLYWLNGRPHPQTGRTYSRAAADKIYRAALAASLLNPVACFVRYTALRWFGWMAWNSHARRIRREKLIRPLQR